MRLGDRRTLTQQIADELREQIRSGQLAPGSRLPSMRAMVSTYGVSSQTAQAAVDLLKAEALVESFPGRATFVRVDLDPAAIPAERPAELSARSTTAVGDDEVSQLRDELVALSERVAADSAAIVDRMTALEQRVSRLEP